MDTGLKSYLVNAEPMPVNIDEIIRSKRKTLQLSVTRDAKVIVRAPLRLSMNRITTFVEAHSDWILKKKQEMKDRLEKLPVLKYKEGDRVFYLGEGFRLTFHPNQVCIAIDPPFMVLPKSFQDKTKERLEKWYKAQARKVICDLLEQMSETTGIRYASYRLSGARKRWGSCSSKNTLNFAWRLVMAHPKAIEYVIVHELCHVIHKNHSKAFWSKVEAIMPDYRVWRKWLKEHQEILY